VKGIPEESLNVARAKIKRAALALRKLLSGFEVARTDSGSARDKQSTPSATLTATGITGFVEGAYEG
jgi:hypothetical protein